MEPIGGDLDRHDHEFEQVKWLSLPEAPAVLTFETERALVALAARRLGWAAPAGRERSTERVPAEPAPAETAG